MTSCTVTRPLSKSLLFKVLYIYKFYYTMYILSTGHSIINQFDQKMHCLKNILNVALATGTKPLCPSHSVTIQCVSSIRAVVLYQYPSVSAPSVSSMKRSFA